MGVVGNENGKVRGGNLWMLVVGKAQEGIWKLGRHHAPGLGIQSPRYSVDNLITYCLLGISASMVALNRISSIPDNLEIY